MNAKGKDVLTALYSLLAPYLAETSDVQAESELRGLFLRYVCFVILFVCSLPPSYSSFCFLRLSGLHSV